MATKKTKNNPGGSPETVRLHEQLAAMHLGYVEQNFEGMGQKAALDQSGHVDYLAQLIDGESRRREDGAIERRIAAARLPVPKTLEQFDWNWPSINQMQVRHLFGLGFLKEKGNVVLIGTVGLGKTHLATALAHAACLKGHSALFTTAINVINSLTAAQAANGGIKREMQKYLKPSLLVIDELGYLPIDKFGADCLFQIVSGRYEQSSTVITSNRAFKNWAEIFNNDSTLTSALLDRLMHHAETVLIEGRSYRMKDQIENPRG